MSYRAKRVTITQVARAAGVSPATVSLVLNGRARAVQISESTVASVSAMAAQLGYTPHHAARSLRRQQTNIITLLVHTLTNPYYTDIASAARRAATAGGYRVNVVETQGCDAESDALAGLRSGDADGVIVATTQHHRDFAPTFHEVIGRGLPMVTVIDYSIDPHNPVIRIDDQAGAYLGTHHLLTLGHTRIAYLTHATLDDLERHERSHARDRYCGYRQALTEAGIAFDPAWVIAGETTPDGGRAAMHALLAQPAPRPTAAFCFNDLIAIGALRACFERGVRVPEDMALVGFDGIDLTAFTTPAISTVAHSRADLGRMAVETLLAMLTGAGPMEAERVLPCQLIVRESCGATRRGPAGAKEGAGA